MRLALLKRLADALEKFAVAAVVMGLFQDKPFGIATGIFGLCVCLVITWRVNK